MVNYTKYRTIGDEKADHVVSYIFSIGEKVSIPKLAKFLGDVDAIGSEFPAIDDFIKHESVIDYKKKVALRACDFYSKHQNSIGLMLACYSLPYCYLAKNGVKVLELSGRLEHDTKKRLQETGAFLKTVMTFSNWESQKAQRAIVKIRLLHALWRHSLSGSPKWDMQWGLPINQEDMLGTNLTFSLLIIRGLRKMGVIIDKTEEESYLDHWSLIGGMLGVLPEIKPTTYKEATQVDKAIAASQFEESSTGKMLTEKLFDTLFHLTKNKLVITYLQSQSRILLGPEYSEWLGIKETRIPSVLLKSVNFTSSIVSLIYD